MAETRSGAWSRVPPSQPVGALELILIGRIGDRRFAVPVVAVERALPMAAPTPVPQAPPGVVGVLQYDGAVLPVVDPRPRLGLRAPRFHPDQRLVMLRAGTRYLLWIDMTERIVTGQVQTVVSSAAPAADSLVTFLAQVDGESIPVLSPRALDPGLIVQHEVSAAG